MLAYRWLIKNIKISKRFQCPSRSPSILVGFLAKCCDQKYISLRLRVWGEPTIVLSDWFLG